VVWVAAHDPRVKAIVAQVGAQDSASMFDADRERFPEGRKGILERRTQRARGELPPVPQGVDQFPGLRGTPHLDRMALYSPRSVADRVRAATLIMDAGEEELFDIEEHGKAVYEIIERNAPAKYHAFEGITHYGIYREKRQEALAMAIAWYDRHLKGGE
jgi:dipeptidyl aminopeptidase/acylaminoacyl peptidase